MDTTEVWTVKIENTNGSTAMRRVCVEIDASDGHSVATHEGAKRGEGDHPRLAVMALACANGWMVAAIDAPEDYETTVTLNSAETLALAMVESAVTAANEHAPGSILYDLRRAMQALRRGQRETAARILAG